MAPQTPENGATPPFPLKQLVILAICRFSEPIAFNSILAYTYVMVEDLNGGENKDTAFYAGLLVSAYAVAEALTAIGWGALSDRYGRKPVVLFGLGGVAISSLIFGLAKNYWVALLARFIGGALNGNVAVMQTMVAEMVKVPEHEPAAYASQPFVWTLGGIFGSAMGGFLAQPARFYPSLFPADGIFGRYPYLLPNLVSVVIIVLAIAQGMLFLEETNPRGTFFAGSAKEAAEGDVAVIEEDESRTDERTHLIPGRRPQHPRISAVSERPAILEEGLPVAVEQSFDLRRTSFGTVHSIQFTPEAQANSAAAPPTIIEEYTGPVFNFTIIMLTVALVLVSYHQMAFATLLPTHLLDRPAAPPGHLDLIGGLGYTVHDVGIYLAVNGVLGLLIQGLIFPIFVDRVGVWHSFIWMIILYPTCYVVMPFLAAFPTPLQSPGIYLAMVLQSFFGIIVIPTALILLKNATPSSTILGRVNGLAMSGCCFARTVSPPVVGIIYAAGGSAAAWFSCAGVAVLGILQLVWVPREHVHDVIVDSAILKINHSEDRNRGGEHDAREQGFHDI
ncbi:major facilitator superfamily domain-containing protein [Xylaria bambusicola]|uniref:major facilitator superfamily domain-containing protein n=1 Tax=Xylaria bambusicola TaxID=326684 RepID=UPI0020081330|nr:major facilitator superfamily domain-containing protein [Xylaria bambusicola]KAI0521315.1 major facilitator superfamily domain-containing protein [Xylaria bambusicola]